MATSTTTIRTTPNTCGSCAAESDQPGVFSFAAVYRGYRQCRRRKRGTANAQRYEHRLLDHLVDTTRSLQDRTYAPSRSLCFVARQPKAREIHAADFLGYIVRPDYRLVRRRVVGNLRLKLTRFARAHVTATSLRLPPAGRDQLHATLASYLGHFAHADAWRLSQSLFAPPGWLSCLFDWRQGRLIPRWEPPAVTSLGSQVRWFRRHFPPALVLVQIGNRAACFEPDLERVLAPCPWLARWYGAQAETRPGLGSGQSWPLTAIKGLGRSLRAAGLAYAFVAEEGYLRGGMKRRVLRFLYRPPHLGLNTDEQTPGGNDEKHALAGVVGLVADADHSDRAGPDLSG